MQTRNIFWIHFRLIVLNISATEGQCLFYSLCSFSFSPHVWTFFGFADMNAAAAAAEGAKAAPPKFKQKESRTFKSKAPKAGQKG